MNYFTRTLPFLFALTALPLFAAPADGGRNDNREIVKMGLYPPDMIMRRQQQLGITNTQRSKIAETVKQFQGNVTELQWSMPNEQQKLQELLASTPIDRKKSLDQVKAVLKMETEFKLAHFELLIAIKNLLTTEQINMLDQAIERRLGRMSE